MEILISIFPLFPARSRISPETSASDRMGRSSGSICEWNLSSSLFGGLAQSLFYSLGPPFFCMSESIILKNIESKLAALDEKVSTILSIEKKKKMQDKLESEETISDWAVKLVRASRRGRLDTLKAKGLI